MPPKVKFTREQILSAALTLTREHGPAAVTARSLGQALGCSTRPIFGFFRSMEELQQQVLLQAQQIYQGRIDRAMQDPALPPYKASGLAYIRFAGEEPELFKLLFMRNRDNEPVAEDREAVRPQIAILQQNLGLSEEDAYLFHLEMWLFVHGIATMIATAYLNWDMALVSRMLTDEYQGLRHRFVEGAAHESH